MATCTKGTGMTSIEQLLNNDGINIDTNVAPVNNVAEQTSSEVPRCFVCDVNVQGRRYALATCRTQSSRARVIEKLGELVGERYMVVISEDDVICRGCANLMNTLDRLETEMKGVRDVILRFLERKYSLDDGELLGNVDTAKPCQPPQITKSQVQNGTGYYGRKRAAVCATNTSSDGTRQKKSNNVWMQCDKCRYTTRYNAFMVHHIRQHIKQQTSCDKCGTQLTAQQTLHLCKEQKHNTQSIVVDDVENDINEPLVETSTGTEPATLNGGKEVEGSIAAIDSDQQSENEARESNVHLIRLRSPDDLQLQNVGAPVDASGTEHGVFVQVLQHDEDVQGDQQAAVQPETGTEMVVNVKESSGKQMLTLGEDGSLEMVEVACWDGVDSSHPDPAIF